MAARGPRAGAAGDQWRQPGRSLLFQAREGRAPDRASLLARAAFSFQAHRGAIACRTQEHSNGREVLP